jgi:hypothetical protein
LAQNFFPPLFNYSEPLYHRSKPVGFDVEGNSYWVLGAQETMTIFPFATNSNATRSNGPIAPVEPCVLMRAVDGWWGYYSGTSIRNLFNSFSNTIECEKVLKDCLIEKLFYTASVLRNGLLKIKSLQFEWIERRLRGEKWINEVKLTNQFTTAQAIRFLELVLGRSFEVRMFLYYSMIYRDEDELLQRISVRAEREALLRKQKRLKDSLQEDVFDFHPIKGFILFI